jgi:hypothetical protein
VVKSYQHLTGDASNDRVWNWALARFIQDHALEPFTLKQIRTTWLDFAHDEFGGDMRALLALGGQKSPDTINLHYMSDGARQRNDERLGEAVNLMWRDRATGDRADARRATEFGGDPGAATPGWICLDPYDSPVPGQRRGRACEAYGRCRGCPLAQIDAGSPIACYYAYDLLARIDEAREKIGPQNWVTKWAPLRQRLTGYWLRLFPEDVYGSSTLLQLRPIPPVE